LFIVGPLLTGLSNIVAKFGGLIVGLSTEVLVPKSNVGLKIGLIGRRWGVGVPT
jgi:hypothetical protein